jgi:putative transposase
MRGNYSNYVHLFVGAEPKYYPSIVMQIIKGITPRKTFKEYSEIKNSYGIVNSGVMKLH